MVRVGRLLRAGGIQARRVITAGVVPQATYGAAVHGASDEELRRLRASTASRLGPSAQGRSLDRLLLLVGDPAHEASVAPIVRWSRQPWAAACRTPGAPDVSAMLGWWRAANPTTCKRWADVRGPMAAAVLSARRLGWTFAGPFTLDDDRGCRIVLTQQSPAMVAAELRDGARRQRERRIAARSPHEDADRFSGAVLRRMVGPYSPLAPHLRAALTAVATKAVWTARRLFRRRLAESPTCVLCFSPRAFSSSIACRRPSRMAR